MLTVSVDGDLGTVWIWTVQGSATNTLALITALYMGMVGAMEPYWQEVEGGMAMPVLQRKGYTVISSTTITE